LTTDFKSVKLIKTIAKPFPGGGLMAAEKKSMGTSAVVVILSALVFLTSLGAFAQQNEIKRVNNATEVLQEIMAIPEKGVPPSLFRDLYGIAVFPKMLKVSLVAGGRYGKGLMVTHTGDGVWSSPVFVELIGGSVGFQIGVQSTDVILVFKSKKSIDGIVKGKFTMGADAAVAAGPVGREVGAETDAALKAEIYSYSRSRGLFAGVSLEGSGLQIDDKSNASYYAKPGITAQDILDGKVPEVPDSAKKFAAELEKQASEK
jgi:lipid-binding SYLF domain-containing protein